MANQLYPLGREAFLAGNLDFDAQDFRISFIPTGYTFNSAHDFYDDVTGAVTPVVVSGALTGKTTTNGTADASDFTLSSVSGSQIVAAVLYQHTGTNSSSRLVAYYDTGGFPTTPNGGDIDVVINASGLFTL